MGPTPVGRGQNGPACAGAGNDREKQVDQISYCMCRVNRAYCLPSQRHSLRAVCANASNCGSPTSKPTSRMKADRRVRLLQRAAVFLIEDVSAQLYAMIFVGVVLVCALLYHGLCPDDGIVTRDNRVTFWDALYFSLVTVSSLGYGDIFPIGWSRVIACLEVLFGLFTMGIIIAKATSFRLAYHVQRLFSSSIHERLQGFAQEFELLRSEFVNAQMLTSSSFDVPAKKEPTGRRPRKNSPMLWRRCIPIAQTWRSMFHSKLTTEDFSRWLRLPHAGD